MAGRIAWILAGGAAIVGGMVMQDKILTGDDPVRHVERKVDREVERATDRKVSSAVDRVIDEQTDRLTVVDGDGQQVDASAEDKKALVAAVAELVKAEAALALADIRDRPRADMRSARDRRDAAERKVDLLAARIKDAERRESVEDQKHEVRDRIRSEFRDAVRG